MNDSELITAVRESVSDVQNVTSVDQIVIRGCSVRARRRVSRLAAGSLAGLAAGALAVNALLPAGQHGASIRLDAWTVQKEADGSVRVMIRLVRVPARGLEGAPRADRAPRCRELAERLEQRGIIIFKLEGRFLREYPGSGKDGLAPRINPAAVPPGTRIVLISSPPAPGHPSGLPDTRATVAQVIRACGANYH